MRSEGKSDCLSREYSGEFNGKSSDKNANQTGGNVSAGRFLLVTGGSGSGKSAFAEEQIMAFEREREYRKFYIATMHPYDEESYRRIDRHRRMRSGKGFETIERYTNLADLLVPSGCCILLECMSNLVANEMFLDEGAKEDTVKQVFAGVQNLRSQTELLVIVTNEIFSEAMTYQGDTERYQQYLGTINCRLAEMADEVVEVVYGIPVYHKRKGTKDEDAVE